MKVKAFIISRQDGKYQPSLNLDELIPEYLEKNTNDILVVEVEVNEISNLDIKKEPHILRNEMKLKMKHLMCLASTWVSRYPGMKVVLLNRLPMTVSTRLVRPGGRIRP